MNISRSPVREAVQRLIYEGLAEHLPHKGAVVSRVGTGDFCLLLEVRELLEGLAARRAATRMTVDDLDHLSEVLNAHETVVDSGDDVANVEYDIAFHRAIRDVAGNPHLQTTLTRIQSRAHLSLYTLWRGGRNPRFALEEHRDIYDALVARDPDRSEAMARRHIQRLRSRVPGLTAVDHDD
jgi:DNA-binding GntR family transcriptional regulator